MKKMRRFVSLIMLISILFSMAVPVYAAAEGNSEFEETGVEMTVSAEPEIEPEPEEVSNDEVPAEEPVPIEETAGSEETAVEAPDSLLNEMAPEETETETAETERELVEYLPDHALWANDVLFLTGKMPCNAVVEAEPVTVEIEGQDVLAAYDIKIYEDETQRLEGRPWQPEGDAVQVHYYDAAFCELDGELSVYHMADEDSESECVATVSAEDGWVSVDAESFSVYAFTTVLEKTISASDGSTYQISVACGADAKIPTGAALEVTELTAADAAYADYFDETMAALEISDADYVKLLDISIVDQQDPSIHYQPQAGVHVTVELLDAEVSAEQFSVVHFSEGPEQLDAATAGNVVSFHTNGFSAYAIVAGPSEVPVGWSKVTTMAELVELGNKGLYVGHTSGFYFTDSLYTVSGSRTGVSKTKPKANYPQGEAARYYFEQAGEAENQFYVYCIADGGKQYVASGTPTENSLTLTTDETGKTVFTVEAVYNTGTFRIGANGWYWNMQGGDSGNGFAVWNNRTDGNNSLYFWYYNDVQSDPYGLDGKTYGIMSYSGGVTGKAMQAEALDGARLSALALNVAEKQDDRRQQLFVPKDTGATMWTFTWVGGDQYYLSAGTGGNVQYLTLDAKGIYLTGEADRAPITVQPGTGDNAGKICIQSGLNAVTFSGLVETGFQSGTSVGGGAWLHLVELSELTSDYFITYSASKVSVSDTEQVTNGSRVIVYTRAWNDAEKKYEFYAIDHNGSLVRVYESGDSIQWLGTPVNTMLWNLVEYYDESTGMPNYYYELYNQYSRNFIAPQIGGQILSTGTIGINLEGRRYGDYYTTIVAWDDPYYAYAGLKVEDGQIVSGPYASADDFYFAILEDMPDDDTLVVVPTVDHTQFGVTMKLVDFNTAAEQNSLLGSSTGGAVQTTVSGLLSTALDDSGYPTATNTGRSLGELYAGAQEVNHLFIASTYSGSGYYEFDSTQNFASLQADGNFKVYQQLGTTDGADKSSLKHGQFFPYDDLEAGRFSSVNAQNLYDATLKALPDSDPRKYEQMYLVSQPDYYFGVEIEASFVQTPSGLDAWGHDVIYQFTGDDDFWLYVDGELVIDLGGIHSALPGTVNFSTGEVTVNNKPTTLYETFRSNYMTRNPDAADEEVSAYLDGIFEQNKAGRYVFKDYTTHTMKIFFMERGAGASNLHMRFNLSSVKPGQVILNKQISGTEKQDYKLAEYAFQILYQVEEDEGFQLLDETDEDTKINVTYQNTNIPVKFAERYTPVGGTATYENVFFLTPSQTVAISVPDRTIQYQIVECGVNTKVYDKVSVNGADITGTAADENRADFAIAPARVSDRQRVVFDNHVSANAMRTLTITPKLYDVEDRLITDDPTEFSLRLYLGNENATELSLAYLQDYYVRDPADHYCRWDAASQSFVSIGKSSYEDLTAEEKLSVTFQTSSNGAISRIRAGYKVEVRDLLVGTQFMVVERPGEIPAGYSFIAYEREGSSYIVDGKTVNSGIIRDSEYPAIIVKNRRGFGLTVNKVWSDASFMDHHGDIFFAVYVNGTLLENSVRALRHPATSVYYYWDTLAEGADLGDYEIREVTGTFTVDPETGDVTGYSDVAAIDEGNTLTVTAKTKEDGSAADFDYVVTYTVGERTGVVGNVRTDTVTNSRHGIRLVAQDWSGDPLSGAAFTLTGSDGAAVGAGTYASDANGLITIAYVNVDATYTLTETKAPGGYRGLETPLRFRLNASGAVEVIEGDPDGYDVIQAEGAQMASIVVKNRPFQLRVVKQAVKTDGTMEPLSGVSFALYREVTVDGRTSMDPTPMPGFDALVSMNGTGLIPSVDQTLAADAYYLKETEAPSGYTAISGPIRFAISTTGIVTLDAQDAAELTCTEDPDGTLVYTITVKNVQTVPAPTGYRSVSMPYAWMLLGGLLLVGAVIWMRKKQYEAE